MISFAFDPQAPKWGMLRRRMRIHINHKHFQIPLLSPHLGVITSKRLKFEKMKYINKYYLVLICFFNSI